MDEHGMWPWRASSALKAILSSALGHKHLGHLIFQSELLGEDRRQYNSAQSIDIHRVCLILPNSMYCSHGCCDSALELQLGVLFLSHLPSSLLGSCYFKDEFRPNQLIIFFSFTPLISLVTTVTSSWLFSFLFRSSFLACQFLSQLKL